MFATILAVLAKVLVAAGLESLAKRLGLIKEAKETIAKVQQSREAGRVEGIAQTAAEHYDEAVAQAEKPVEKPTSDEGLKQLLDAANKAHPRGRIP